MEMKMLLLYVACIIAIFIIGKIFIVPIKIIVKLILNSILGGIIIWLINIVGAMWSIHIGINVVTVLITGILGIPGVILLLIVSIFIIWKYKVAKKLLNI